jgi:ribonuclease III
MVTRNPVAEGILVILFAVILPCFSLMRFKCTSLASVHFHASGIIPSTLPSPHMETWQKLLEEIPVVESKIGYTFKEKELLALAFVHRSFVNENKENIVKHNERLEFFGDSILGLLISEYLFKYLPSTPEGDLSRYRSRLVEACSCMLYVKKLDLWSYVLMGKGERQNDGRGRDSILANLFEALLAAVYLDGGIESARRFLFKNFSEEINQILKTPIRNWKAILQNYTQQKFHQPPVYKTLSEEGPDHGKTFYISVHVNGNECGRGTGASKKEAQQAAAQTAIDHFGDVEEE